MLIISQSRTYIINTNTLISIWIEPSVKHETVVIRGIIDYDVSSFGINMGCLLYTSPSPRDCS